MTKNLLNFLVIMSMIALAALMTLGGARARPMPPPAAVGFSGEAVEMIIGQYGKTPTVPKTPPPALTRYVLWVLLHRLREECSSGFKSIQHFMSHDVLTFQLTSELYRLSL